VPKTFDSDFYVVCATVIPVLFIVAAVQGNSYKTLLDSALRVRVTQVGDGWARKFIARIRARTLVYIAYLIWGAGACGEILALLVLYRGQEQPYDRKIVLLCTIFLVFVASAGPLNAFVQVRDKLDKWRDSQPEIEQSDGLFGDEIDHAPSKISGLGWPEELWFDLALSRHSDRCRELAGQDHAQGFAIAQS
jgi:hypothetical protein